MLPLCFAVTPLLCTRLKIKKVLTSNTKGESDDDFMWWLIQYFSIFIENQTKIFYHRSNVSLSGVVQSVPENSSGVGQPQQSRNLIKAKPKTNLSVSGFLQQFSENVCFCNADSNWSNICHVKNLDDSSIVESILLFTWLLPPSTTFS